MIKYRYTNLDPEPGPHVTRIGTDGWRHFGYYHGGVKRWNWGDRWRRIPCAGLGHGTVITSGSKRKEERWHVREGWGPLPKRHRRSYHLHLRAHRVCRPQEAGKYPNFPNWTGHSHWWNEDKTRHWGSLRGATLRFDLDAYRRLHHAYPKKWKKRK